MATLAEQKVDALRHVDAHCTALDTAQINAQTVAKVSPAAQPFDIGCLRRAGLVW